MTTAATLATTHALAFTQSRPWSADEFENLLSQPGVILLGDAKSFILARIIGDEAEVLTIATHPDFQRLGLAKAAIGAFIDQVKAAGVVSIFLEVAQTNDPAKSLYFKAGFTVVGHRPKYYARPDGTAEGADVMRLSVSPQQSD